MSLNAPSFTLGVEEEYLLVDRETRDLADDPPAEIWEEAARLCEDRVTAEYLRSQIEVGTKVCRNVQEVRHDLSRLRRVIIDVAGRHGLAPIAASTHPFGQWLDQKYTPKERYESLSREMQAAARRLLICGMHVHVGIEDDELRIDLLNQMTYFLPHLLAISCSSPFWRGEDTGLKSYRLTVFGALPRTGLPERFHSYGEYERHVKVLINAGLIADTTKLWWDLRPSARFPTLETRVMDVCTRIDDAIAVTALVVCILRMLYRLRCQNQRWRHYADMLIDENRWRAMRYSYDEGMIDLARQRIVPVRDLMCELLELVREDASALGCTEDVNNALHILERGTSAHRQLEVFNTQIENGASRREALNAVVDMLIADTAMGL
jgi:carboxylate-amine ligase